MRSPHRMQLPSDVTSHKQDAQFAQAARRQTAPARAQGLAATAQLRAAAARMGARRRAEARTGPHPAATDPPGGAPPAWRARTARRQPQLPSAAAATAVRALSPCLSGVYLPGMKAAICRRCWPGASETLGRVWKDGVGLKTPATGDGQQGMLL